MAKWIYSPPQSNVNINNFPLDFEKVTYFYKINQFR